LKAILNLDLIIFPISLLKNNTGEKSMDEIITLEGLKQLAERANSDFFTEFDAQHWFNENELEYESYGLFEDYLSSEEGYKARLRAICTTDFKEKWNMFKQVAMQIISQSYVMWGSNEAIIDLLPFVSDILYTEGALWIVVDTFTPKMLCAFANVCEGEYTQEGENIFCARWEGSVWEEEATKEIINTLEKKGYKVL